MKVFFLFFLFFSTLLEASELSSRLLDEGQTFTSEEQSIVRQKLDQFKLQKNIDLVIINLKSLDGESIESIANRRFNEYQIGEKGVDNGLLFIFSVKDRKMRLEVGKGLEGTIPDVVAKRILSDEINPIFKERRYFDGVLYLVQKLSESELEIQASFAKRKIPFVVRLIPLLFSLSLGLFVFLLGVKNEVLYEQKELDQVYGNDWPLEALRFKVKVPRYRKFQKAIVVIYTIMAIFLSLSQFFYENEIFLMLSILVVFVFGFIFIAVLKFLQFNAPWALWYKTETDPVKKEKIKKILTSYGYQYSKRADSFVAPSQSRSSSSSSSSSSSPSGGGSSSGGGASSDW